MFLRLAKSVRGGWFSPRTYLISVQLECDPFERTTIARHALLRHRLYTNPDTPMYAEHARAERDRARTLSPFRKGQRGKRAWHNWQALISTIRARSAFNITVAQLIAGTVINCSDLDELAETETALIAGFDALQLTIDSARRFDDRDETIFLSGDDDEKFTPPAKWPRFGAR